MKKGNKKLAVDKQNDILCAIREDVESKCPELVGDHYFVAHPEIIERNSITERLGNTEEKIYGNHVCVDCLSQDY